MGLRDRYAISEPCCHEEPERRILCREAREARRGKRHRNFGRRPWRHAGEPAPAHADNRIRITVDPDDLADNCRIAAKLSLPVFVAEDGDRRAGDCSRVFRPDQPAQIRRGV